MTRSRRAAQDVARKSRAGVLPPKPKVLGQRVKRGAPGFVPLVWKGGSIIGWPQLVSLFWGDFTQQQVDTMHTYLSDYAGYLQGQGAPDRQTCVVWLYGVGGGDIAASHLENAQPRNATESDVRDLIHDLQRAGTLPGFAANRLFLVFTHGITFNGYGTDWCGYHDSWGNGEYFAIIPYPSVAGCGSDDPAASWESVTSHEINEAATDPAPGSGWVAGTEEGGDTCSWQEFALNFGTVQRFEDNLQSACSVWVPKGLFDWSFVGNTAGFGHGINDGRPFWIGDFTGDGRADVLFYYPGDDNWWLGSYDGNELQWSFAGNTAGFGHGINDGRPFWIGRFSESDRSQVLFYYPGDGNWWLGSQDGNGLQWSFVGNTLGTIGGEPNFGQVWDGRPFWIGDFTADGRDDVLFYYPGDGNWWLGSHTGRELGWEFATRTTVFGMNIADGRPFWVGGFSKADRSQVLFYYPGDDNWWLGGG
jgi:hypothetical protein